jgi:hypothetical protein
LLGLVVAAVALAQQLLEALVEQAGSRQAEAEVVEQQ